RDGEVGDHAVLHRPYRGDVAWRSPQHLFRGEADFLDHALAVGTAFLANRHHRRLVEYDALTANVDERIRRAEVDRQIAGEIAFEKFEHEAFRLQRKPDGSPAHDRGI